MGRGLIMEIGLWWREVELCEEVGEWWVGEMWEGLREIDGGLLGSVFMDSGSVWVGIGLESGLWEKKIVVGRIIDLEFFIWWKGKKVLWKEIFLL